MEKTLILVLVLSNFVLVLLYIRTALQNVKLQQEIMILEEQSEFKKYLEEKKSQQKKHKEDGNE